MERNIRAHREKQTKEQNESTPFNRQMKYFYTLLGFTFSLVISVLVVLVLVSLLPWTINQSASAGIVRVYIPVLNEYTVVLGIMLPFSIIYWLATFCNVASSEDFPTSGWEAAVAIPLKRGFVAVIWSVSMCLGFTGLSGHFHYYYMEYIWSFLFVFSFAVMDISGRSAWLDRKLKKRALECRKTAPTIIRRRSTLSIVLSGNANHPSMEMNDNENSDSSDDRSSALSRFIDFFLYFLVMNSIGIGFPLFLIPWFMRYLLLSLETFIILSNFCQLTQILPILIFSELHTALIPCCKSL